MMLGDLGEEYIQITVTSPHKVGDGISSYMAYTVKTNTNLSYFKVSYIDSEKYKNPLFCQNYSKFFCLLIRVGLDIRLISNAVHPVSRPDIRNYNQPDIRYVFGLKESGLTLLVMLDRLTGQVNYILHDHWYRES